MKIVWMVYTSGIPQVWEQYENHMKVI